MCFFIRWVIKKTKVEIVDIFENNRIIEWIDHLTISSWMMYQEVRESVSMGALGANAPTAYEKSPIYLMLSICNHSPKKV